MRMYEVRGPIGFKNDFEEPSCAAIADVVMWSCWLLAVAIIYVSPAGQDLHEKEARLDIQPLLSGRS
jgi:hypothetical protein